jgi:hypothetical protein
MLTKKEIQELAAKTIQHEGILIAHALNAYCDSMDGNSVSAANLVPLLEIFAERLEAAKAKDTTAIIDARMGIGWTRSLAEALSDEPPR